MLAARPHQLELGLDADTSCDGCIIVELPDVIIVFDPPMAPLLDRDMNDLLKEPVKCAVHRVGRFHAHTPLVAPPSMLITAPLI